MRGHRRFCSRRFFLDAAGQLVKINHHDLLSAKLKAEHILGPRYEIRLIREKARVSDTFTYSVRDGKDNWTRRVHMRAGNRGYELAADTMREIVYYE